MACYVCKETFREEWALRTEDQLLFHTECFRCVDCKKDLTAVGVGSAMDTRCVKCQNKKKITCKACQKPIESQYHKRVGVSAYHMECLVCDQCRHSFDDDEKTCYPIEGKLYCLECHWNKRTANYLRDTATPTKLVPTS